METNEILNYVFIAITLVIALGMFLYLDKKINEIKEEINGCGIYRIDWLAYEIRLMKQIKDNPAKFKQGDIVDYQGKSLKIVQISNEYLLKNSKKVDEFKRTYLADEANHCKGEPMYIITVAEDDLKLIEKPENSFNPNDYNYKAIKELAYHISQLKEAFEQYVQAKK